MNLPFKVDLSNKVVAITGAGGVICGEFARALAACGAKVALLDINFEAAKKVAEEIGKNALAVQCNCLDKQSVVAAKEAVGETFGKVNFLINGAGGNNPRATTDNEFHYEAKDIENCKTFFDLEKSGVEFVFSLNWLGTLLPTQVFAADMIDRSGNILNIASMNAYTPLTKIPAYSGAKSAIVNFTQWLATYFAKSGIRVNAIAPGFFVGNQNRGLLFNPDGTPTPRTGKILAGTPMGRFGELEELVGAVLFLLNNEAASFITGVCIPIDGGYAAYSGV